MSKNVENSSTKLFLWFIIKKRIWFLNCWTLSYKIGGPEITVNSISSLQALIDSETIKENTKVKAGLRGKWTTADKIEGVVFAKEEEIVDDNYEGKTILPGLSTTKPAPPFLKTAGSVL